jgi:lysyl-tRNA synthetase class 2
MKRLLASGSGSIYQICKAFRNGEAGRFHNPEFTILEWYRVGFDLTHLMDEVEALFNDLFDNQLGTPQRIAYSTVFAHHTGLDALTFSHQAYCDFAKRENLHDAITLCGESHALWLDFLFSFCVQPHLGKNALCLIYDYPACQSSLARLNVTNPLLTERVEVFINGVELGNGFYELTHAAEQNARFDAEIAMRKNEHLPLAIKDTRLISALEAGLPDCAGIAIGLDRLLMMLEKSAAISDVLSFDVTRA